MLSQSPDTSQTASGPHNPHPHPDTLSDPSDDFTPKKGPASIATGSEETEHVVNQPCNRTQPHRSHHDSRQQLPSGGADTSRAASTSQQELSSTEHSTRGSGRPLPKLTVSDVSPEVFRLVLEFAYSGSLQVLPPRWLKAAGAELLFEAAQRYLMPLLKVEVMPPNANSAARCVMALSCCDCF